jgi:hypothetical protein
VFSEDFEVLLLPVGPQMEKKNQTVGSQSQGKEDLHNAHFRRRLH